MQSNSWCLLDERVGEAPADLIFSRTFYLNCCSVSNTIYAVSFACIWSSNIRNYIASYGVANFNPENALSSVASKILQVFISNSLQVLK